MNSLNSCFPSSFLSLSLEKTKQQHGRQFAFDLFMSCNFVKPVTHANLQTFPTPHVRPLGRCLGYLLRLQSYLKNGTTFMTSQTHLPRGLNYDVSKEWHSVAWLSLCLLFHLGGLYDVSHTLVMLCFDSHLALISWQCCSLHHAHTGREKLHDVTLFWLTPPFV